MGLLRKIADYLDPVEQRDFESSMLSAFGPGVGMVNVGHTTPRLAENLSTVLACVNAISSAIASLPVFIYRFEGNSRRIDDAHPLNRLIRDGANDHQTFGDFLEWLSASALLRGNAVAEIQTDNRGAVVALVPHPWDTVQVQQLRNGRIVYDIVGNTGQRRRLLQSEALHIKDRSDDGVVGVSRLRRAGAVISTALETQSFAGHIFKNGAFPSGAVEADQPLSPTTRERFATAFRESFTGSHNTAKVLMLDSGMKWRSISIDPQDIEFLAHRRFEVEELCRLYNVPPPIAGDLSHGSFANVEHLIRWFSQSTLTPWVRKLESEFARSVFTENSRRTHSLTIDLSGLLRGSPGERWQSWKIALETGVLTPQQVAQEEGF